MIAVFLIFLILTFIFLFIGLSDFLRVMGKQLRELTLSCSSDTDSTTIEGGGKSNPGFFFGRMSGSYRWLIPPVPWVFGRICWVFWPFCWVFWQIYWVFGNFTWVFYISLSIFTKTHDFIYFSDFSMGKRWVFYSKRGKVLR